ncbi:MarR family transcriptional regulator [Paenibacillus athensensis]|uniref:HTH marR-type domain-containing protein n=1 Tax=Paenibacillus athensensis TaxID=1967502 RepID=A0A4Y8PUH5_9BACL|nr:MarR family transcriptional regulator [Paenibacillus athensensis]MCD1261719.1 MarR family transcriptional regulator [Paenibacillus athensensis]
MSRRTPKISQLLSGLSDEFRIQSTNTVLFHQLIADYLGLNITDHKCLNYLIDLGPLTAGRLAELTHLTTGAITGVIDRLEKAGFVRRVKDPNDRRRVIIECVPESMARLQGVFEPLGRMTDEICLSYSEEELVFLLAFMKKINGRFQQELASFQANLGRLDDDN